jgi:ABC-2 type transport system ATP-binding protein
VIEARSLTKKFGDKAAVENLSFTVPPGVVTGFLGPNGAGKSTTMRMILGLDRPTSGSALVNGHPYDHARRRLNEIGALLDARNVHGAARPMPTCWRWRRATTSREIGLMQYSRWSV